MKKTILFLALASSLLIGAYFVTNSVHAEKKCGDVKTAFIECKADSASDKIEDTPIWHLLQIAVNILSGGVAVAAIIGLVYGGIVYSSAQDNQAQVQKAIGIIRNVVIGIVAYVLMYSVLQFIIPGGIF